MALLSERIDGIMIHVDLKSSQLKSATYNTETESLTIIFYNDAVYEYEKVPWVIFTKFRMSDSQGKFFSANIKTKYTFKKIK